MTRWTDQTTEHVKAAINANTCPLCGGRLRWTTWHKWPGGPVVKQNRQCGNCGAEVDLEPEPPCQLVTDL